MPALPASPRQRTDVAGKRPPKRYARRRIDTNGVSRLWAESAIAKQPSHGTGIFQMRPDKTEKTIRFRCGFTFGQIVGFFSAIQIIVDAWGPSAAVAVAVAVVCGFLAKRYGDRFWHTQKNWWYWT